jgi:dolichol-phosphate mannosyltransferase
MKIFVVPATYNEKNNIEKFITILQEEVFPKIKNHEMHILVADDNSPDGTGDIVKSLMKKYKNLGINQGEKKGLGAAYVRTMSYAIEKMGADVVMSIDADLQHDPHSIPSFLKKIDEGYDIVIGTRYSNGGSMPKTWPFQRKMFSVVANLTVRIITGRFDIHDWTGGFRAIRKKVFMKEKEKVKAFSGYHFQVGFLYKSLLDGFTVGEVPIHFHARHEGSSKIAPLEYIIKLLLYVIEERLHEMLTGSFGKFLVVGGIGFIINFLILKILSDSFQWDHSLANLVGAAVAIFSNYNFNNLWTFSHQKIHGFMAYVMKLLQFYATSIFGVIFIQTGTIFLGDRFIGEGNFHILLTIKYYYIYFVIGTGLLLIWNFFIYSKFIWKKK